MRTELKGKKFPVDNQGWIMLTDYMGNDHSIANCARTCYGNRNASKANDEHLIRYMMRHGHTSPFEQAELQFLVYVPMDTWRQWIRHRTASVNEHSTRYAEAINQTYEAVEWRKQSQNNRQGSDGVFEGKAAEALTESEQKFHQTARDLYRIRVSNGVAREQARKDLPLSTFTRAYWKIDLHNLFHFLKLRLDQHAQQEIRHYAERIAEIVSIKFPMSWAAFRDYELDAVKFSAAEVRALLSVIRFPSRIQDMTAPENWIGEIPADWSNPRCRERDEFIEKVNKILPENERFDVNKFQEEDK